MQVWGFVVMVRDLTVFKPERYEVLKIEEMQGLIKGMTFQLIKPLDYFSNG